MVCLLSALQYHDIGTQLPSEVWMAIDRRARRPALREAWRAKRFTMDELDRYAAICRVQRVMRPYLEALTA